MAAHAIPGCTDLGPDPEPFCDRFDRLLGDELQQEHLRCLERMASRALATSAGWDHEPVDETAQPTVEVLVAA